MFRENARKPTIWPEWTEAELAAEKWDLSGGKGRAKSAATVNLAISLDTSLHNYVLIHVHDLLENLSLPPAV